MSRAGQPPIDVCVLHELRTVANFVSMSNLISSVWIDRGLDEPETARHLIKQSVCRLRLRGFEIKSRPGRNTPGFHLVCSPVSA